VVNLDSNADEDFGLENSEDEYDKFLAE